MSDLINFYANFAATHIEPKHVKIINFIFTVEIE